MFSLRIPATTPATRPATRFALVVALCLALSGMASLGLATIALPGIAHAETLQTPVQTLPSEPLKIDTKMGSFEFNVEIADTPQTRSIGLMNRKSMDVKHGMLFDFQREDIVTMWMKNTYIPLDMIFIRADGTVARIAANTTPHSTDIITSGEPVTHVLEVKGGVAKMIDLKPGDHIEHRFFAR